MVVNCNRFATSVLIVLCMKPTEAQYPSAHYNGSVASCTIDVITAGDTLADAGAVISQATKMCPDASGTDKKITCGVSVSRIVEMLLYSASFLSSAAQQCSKAFHLERLFNGLGLGNLFGTVQEQQACAGVVTGFTAGLGQVSESALALTEACSWSGARRAQNGTALGSAALTPLAQAEGLGGPKDQMEAQCAMDVVGAVSSLSRASNSLFTSTKRCPTSTSSGQLGAEAQAACGYDIGNVIMSFAWVSNAISLAVTHCSMLLNVDAMCAGSITNLLAGLSDIAGMGSGLQANCPVVDKAVNSVGNLFA